MYGTGGHAEADRRTDKTGRLGIVRLQDDCRIICLPIITAATVKLIGNDMQPKKSESQTIGRIKGGE